MKRRKDVYLDYAAGCPVDPRVIKAMRLCQGEGFGNSMSIHSWGRRANEAIEKSRGGIAGFIGAKSGEIIFTGSATESNNLALKGWQRSQPDKKHIIVSAIEHKCVLETAGYLGGQGYEVTYLKVNDEGLVDMGQLKREIRKDTLLVSVMHVNNEVGVIEEVEQVGRICRAKGVMFHCDAAQSFTKLNINVEKMKIDLLTLSSHKIYGPKGAGVLYVRQGLEKGLEPLLHGGGQERGLRSSTMNTAAVVGMARAAEIGIKEMVVEGKRLGRLKEKFVEKVLAEIPGVMVNGSREKSVVNSVNMSFDRVEGEAILLSLDAEGIKVSTGSACSSDDLKPSYVLRAMGYPVARAHGSIRFSWGRWTDEADMNYVVEVLTGVVKKLRRLSPIK